MKEKGLLGEKEIKLEATLHKPDGDGPFPVVIFSHGSSGGPIPASYTEKAKLFAACLNRKGISLLIPMRPGRGLSEGSNKEEPSLCTVEAAKEGLAYASASTDAVMNYLRMQSWASTESVVLAGHSRGGILSLPYAAEHPQVARAAINFSGGWKNDNCGPEDINLALFAEAAKHSTVPALFIYGRGDGFYSDTSITRYATIYKENGGDVEFKFYSLNGVNGHAIFHKAQSIWENDLDAFLVRIGFIRRN
ncbi:MAG: hypothetical protein E6Q34_01480 [Burkholderiaceae bacterium]|nr:MAG: hypothetical protein E6Q34_01480 [Burkholderiaceae bacterium]